MSWVVEQSESTSTVNVNGNTVTCTSDGSSGSPINVMYKDPANQNGQYFWQLEVKDSVGQSDGNVSVGLTTEQGFQSGWGLKAMKYLGNLSDGSSLLVQAFGEQIKNNDRVGILAQLTDADLKVYLFHNDQPLGLAFHVQSPYPKPLYPVVSFDSGATVKISRSQQIPTSLNRGAAQGTGIEGSWKISKYAQHPECVGYQFTFKRQGQNKYNLYARVVNTLNCVLEQNSSTNQYTVSPVMSTLMAGPPEEMNKEHVVNGLISNIKNLEVQGDQQLTIQTNTGEQVQLQRYAVPPPSAVTHNIYN